MCPPVSSEWTNQTAPSFTAAEVRMCHMTNSLSFRLWTWSQARRGAERTGGEEHHGSFFLQDYRPRPPPLGGPLGAGPPLLGTGPGPPPGPQPPRPPRPDGP